MSKTTSKFAPGVRDWAVQLNQLGDEFDFWQGEAQC